MSQLYGYLRAGTVLALNNQAAFEATDESVRAVWTPVPPEAKVGSVRNQDGSWEHPPAPPPADIVVDVPTFFMLFTIGEETSIRASQDPGVKVLLQRLDHPATKAVNLSLQANIAAINYLAAQGLITEARAAEILTGQVS